MNQCGFYIIFVACTLSHHHPHPHLSEKINARINSLKQFQSSLYLINSKLLRSMNVTQANASKQASQAKKSSRPQQVE